MVESGQRRLTGKVKGRDGSGSHPPRWLQTSTELTNEKGMASLSYFESHSDLDSDVLVKAPDDENNNGNDQVTRL